MTTRSPHPVDSHHGRRRRTATSRRCWRCSSSSPATGAGSPSATGPRAAGAWTTTRAAGCPTTCSARSSTRVVHAVLAWRAGRPAAVERPDGDELAELMDFVMGETVPHEYAPLLSEDMGFTAARASAAATPDDVELPSW